MQNDIRYFALSRKTVPGVHSVVRAPSLRHAMAFALPPEVWHVVSAAKELPVERADCNPFGIDGYWWSFLGHAVLGDDGAVLPVTLVLPDGWRMREVSRGAPQCAWCGHYHRDTRCRVCETSVRCETLLILVERQTAADGDGDDGDERDRIDRVVVCVECARDLIRIKQDALLRMVRETDTLAEYRTQGPPFSGPR